MRLVRWAFAELARGGPMSRVWLWHASFGCVGCALLSLPSDREVIVLAPMFLIAGMLTAWAAVRRQAKVGCVGLGLLMVAAWGRALALWGLDQGGVGSNLIASFTWCWVAGTALLVFISTWFRGLS